MATRPCFQMLWPRRNLSEYSLGPYLFVCGLAWNYAKDIFWPFLFSFFLLAFDVIYPSLRLLPFVDSGQFCHCRYVGTLVAGGFMWEYVINLLMDTKLTGSKRSSLY